MITTDLDLGQLRGKVCFAGDAEMLSKRSYITGIRPVSKKGIRYGYEKTAFVPDLPDDPGKWRRPDVVEVQPYMATPETPAGLIIDIFFVPPHVTAQAKELINNPALTHKSVASSSAIELFPGVWGLLDTILKSKGNMRTTIELDPQRTHSQGGKAKKNIGVHVDSVPLTQIEDRYDDLDRVLVHAGGDSRFSVQVITSNIFDTAETLSPGDQTFAPRRAEVSRYFSRDHNYRNERVLMIELCPGEGIRFKHHVTHHTGSTLRKGPSSLLIINEDPSRRWGLTTFRPYSLLHAKSS
jgi:hypothetical protein